MRKVAQADESCGIARVLDVLGDRWSLLILREIAAGITRFNALQRRLDISRRVLAERLADLTQNEILSRHPYCERPLRMDYRLTSQGQGLMPVLVALQDWGTRYLIGNGDLTANAASELEARRVLGLVGRRLPQVELCRPDGSAQRLPITGGWRAIVLFPGLFVPGGQEAPAGWEDIPGARGCLTQAMTLAERFSDFAAAAAEVVGVSIQGRDVQARFLVRFDLPFQVLWDEGQQLAAGLGLSTFRAGGLDHFKRATFLVDPEGVIRFGQFPITDPVGSVGETLDALHRLTAP